MEHIKSFDEFIANQNTTGVGDTNNTEDEHENDSEIDSDFEEKIANVTVEKKGYVVECDGDQLVVKASTNEDGNDNTLLKIAEAARKLGATHIYNENENPKKMAVNEIIGAMKRLFRKQPQHKSIWGHINQD